MNGTVREGAIQSESNRSVGMPRSGLASCRMAVVLVDPLSAVWRRNGSRAHPIRFRIFPVFNLKGFFPTPVLFFPGFPGWLIEVFHSFRLP